MSENTKCSYCKIRNPKENSEYCSEKCSKNFDAWQATLKKQIKLNENGYLQHKKYGLLHRHVYELHFGKLKPNYIVHHIDGDKVNNDLTNLIAMPAHCHDLLHQAQRERKSDFDRDECTFFIKKYLDKVNEAIRDRDEFVKTLEALDLIIENFLRTPYEKAQKKNTATRKGNLNLPNF